MYNVHGILSSKMKNKKYHIVGTVPKSNGKIVETFKSFLFIVALEINDCHRLRLGQ